MIDTDSVGQREMRALGRRLQVYADEFQGQPSKAFDLKKAAELLEHRACLTMKARPAEANTRQRVL